MRTLGVAEKGFNERFVWEKGFALFFFVVCLLSSFGTAAQDSIENHTLGVLSEREAKTEASSFLPVVSVTESSAVEARPPTQKGTEDSSPAKPLLPSANPSVSEAGDETGKEQTENSSQPEAPQDEPWRGLVINLPVDSAAGTPVVAKEATNLGETEPPLLAQEPEEHPLASPTQDKGGLVAQESAVPEQSTETGQTLPVATLDQGLKDLQLEAVSEAPKGVEHDPFTDVFGPSSVDVGNLSSLASLKPDILEPIGLEEAAAFALKNNHEVKSMGARSQGSRWDYASSFSQMAPSIEMTVASGAEKSSPGSYNGPDGTRIKDTTHHRIDRNWSIRQPLIDLVAIADIMKASVTVDLADAEKRDAQETTVLASINTFLKLLQARKSIELFDEYKKVLGELAERMKARLEEGGATNADLNRIQSRLNVAEAARLEALGAYGINIAEFKRITGVVPSRFEFPEKLAPDVPATAHEALAMAWKANPTYLASTIKESLARRDRDKTIAGAMPKVSVEYSDVYTYNAGGTAHGPPIDGSYPNQKDERIMLVAKWSVAGLTPITSGMSGIKKTEEMKLKSQDVKARIEQGMHTSYDGLNAARQRVSILKESFATDRRIVAELEEQFMQGTRSIFELLDSQDRLHETKIALVNAMFTEALSAYQVRMQMGEIVRAVLGNEGGRDGGR